MTIDVAQREWLMQRAEERRRIWKAHAMTDQNKWETCKHDGRFFIQASFNPVRPPYIYACSHQCGFWLNFNPHMAGLVRTVEWHEKIVCYTVETQGDKQLPPLSPSRF